MSTVTTTITLDGREIEKDSPEAYKLAAQMLSSAFDILNDPILASLEPEDARAVRQKITGALMDLGSYARALAANLERYKGDWGTAEAEAFPRLREADRRLKARN